MLFRSLLLAALLAYAFANATTPDNLKLLESRIYTVDVSPFVDPYSSVEISDAFGGAGSESEFHTDKRLAENGSNKQSLAIKSNILWIFTFLFSLFFTVACFLFNVPIIFV